MGGFPKSVRLLRRTFARKTRGTASANLASSQKLVVVWFATTIIKNSRCLLLAVSGSTRSSCSVLRWLRNTCVWGLEDDSDADIRAIGSYLQRSWSEELLSAHALLVIIDVITSPYRHYRISQISYGQYRISQISCEIFYSLVYMF